MPDRPTPPATGPTVGAAGADEAEQVAAAEPTADDDRTADLTLHQLALLRERIDEIDRRIVELLNERAQIALEIGRVKQRTGRRTVRDARREAEVIERVTSASAGLFPEPELVALYRKLIAATRRVQHAQKRAAASASDRAGQAGDAVAVDAVVGDGRPDDDG